MGWCSDSAHTVSTRSAIISPPISIHPFAQAERVASSLLSAKLVYLLRHLRWVAAHRRCERIGDASDCATATHSLWLEQLQMGDGPLELRGGCAMTAVMELQETGAIRFCGSRPNFGSEHIATVALLVSILTRFPQCPPSTPPCSIRDRPTDRPTDQFTSKWTLSTPAATSSTLTSSRSLALYPLCGSGPSQQHQLLLLFVHLARGPL